MHPPRINGKLAGFSTARLFRFLNTLGRDVEIVVKSKSHAQAQTRVAASPEASQDGTEADWHQALWLTRLIDGGFQ